MFDEDGLPDIFSDEFMETVVAATKRAREYALVAGRPITYQDPSGCYVREMPDGRRFEIRFRPESAGSHHDSQRVVPLQSVVVPGSSPGFSQRPPPVAATSSSAAPGPQESRA